MSVPTRGMYSRTEGRHPSPRPLITTRVCRCNLAALFLSPRRKFLDSEGPPDPQPCGPAHTAHYPPLFLATRAPAERSTWGVASCGGHGICSQLDTYPYPWNGTEPPARIALGSQKSFVEQDRGLVAFSRIRNTTWILLEMC